VTARQDPGLQPERTELAWRRTLLAMAVGALVSMRLLPPVLGDAAVLVGAAGLVAIAALWVLAHRRLRRATAVFQGRSPAPMPGGALLLALALLTAGASALGLALVLLPRLVR
jgi:uncharacterized membrane protein YidH (DUF202 family)